MGNGTMEKALFFHIIIMIMRGHTFCKGEDRFIDVNEVACEAPGLKPSLVPRDPGRVRETESQGRMNISPSEMKILGLVRAIVDSTSKFDPNDMQVVQVIVQAIFEARAVKAKGKAKVVEQRPGTKKSSISKSPPENGRTSASVAGGTKRKSSKPTSPSGPKRTKGRNGETATAAEGYRPASAPSARGAKVSENARSSLSEEVEIDDPSESLVVDKTLQDLDFRCHNLQEEVSVMKSVLEVARCQRQAHIWSNNRIKKDIAIIISEEKNESMQGRARDHHDHSEVRQATGRERVAHPRRPPPENASMAPNSVRKRPPAAPSHVATPPRIPTIMEVYRLAQHHQPSLRHQPTGVSNIYKQISDTLHQQEMKETKAGLSSEAECSHRQQERHQRTSREPTYSKREPMQDSMVQQLTAEYIKSMNPEAQARMQVQVQTQIEKQKMIAEQQQQQMDYMKGRWNQQNGTEHYPERNHQQSLRIEQPRDALPATRRRADGEGSSSLTHFRCRGQPQQHSLVPHNGTQVSLPHNGTQVVSPRSPESQSPPRHPPVHLTYNLLESMIQNVVRQKIAGNRIE